MLYKDWEAKMFEDHPELPELLAETERIRGEKAEYRDCVIDGLLAGKTPQQIAEKDTYWDL